MTSWDLQIDGHGHLVDAAGVAEPGPPPDITWEPVELYALTAAEGQLFGRGIALSDHRGLEYNLILVSDVFTDDAGAWVRVVSYQCFVEWGRVPEQQRSRTPTPARAVPARQVWVQHERPAGK